VTAAVAVSADPPQRRRALLGAAAILWPTLLLLQACATAPSIRAADVLTQGRLALRVDASASQPAQSLSAGFELQGDGNRGELRLFSPLGTRLVTASWSAQGAQLSTSDGERSFDSLDALAEEALGEAVPLAALPDWLAGRPWAGAGHQPGAQGFEQLGWQVTTSRLAEGQLEARRAAAPAVLLRVRLDLPS
jgi:outer membrane lipoprotein LolB